MIYNFLTLQSNCAALLSSGMVPLMRSQIGGLGEALPTARKLALKGLLPSVGPHMGSQVEIQRKLLSANLAGIVLLFSVNQSVSLKLGLIKELLIAAVYFTDVLLLPMESEMLLQFINIREGFGASLELAGKDLLLIGLLWLYLRFIPVY